MSRFHRNLVDPHISMLMYMDDHCKLIDQPTSQCPVSLTYLMYVNNLCASGPVIDVCYKICSNEQITPLTQASAHLISISKSTT